jgi:septum formation protein
MEFTVPIILASASPRRIDLLTQAGIPFIVQPAGIDEEKSMPEGPPEHKAETLALLKALEVARMVGKGLVFAQGSVNGHASTSNVPPAILKQAIVIGADTIVVLDSEIFGKPLDKNEALYMLKRLNGRAHRVITGLAVIDTMTGHRIINCESSNVFFSKLSEREMEAYVKSGEPEGKAGAYAIQGKGALFVDKIDGCYTNVVGLPLSKLRTILGEFGIRLI